MTATAAEVLYTHRHRLRAIALRRYPYLCRGRADDAVGDILLQAVSRSGRWEEVLRREGEGALLRYAAKAVARSAKDQVRRRAYRNEVGGDSLEGAAASPAGPTLLAMRDLNVLIDASTQQVSPTHAPLLGVALWTKILEGDTDTAVAERLGVRREYVNRAWRHLQGLAA